MIILQFKDTDFQNLECLFCRNDLGNKLLQYESLYPSRILDKIPEIHLKAWMVKKAINNIAGEIKSSHTADLVAPWKNDLENVIKNKTNREKLKGSIIVFEHKSLILHTETLFNEIKSFLDILAKTIAGYLEIKGTITSFGKKNNDPGGKFLDILERNTPREHKTTSKKFIKIIKKNKKIWLDFCVHTRDTASHYKTLQNKIILRSDKIDLGSENLKIKTYFGNEDFLEKIGVINKNFDIFLKEVISILREGKK